MGTLSAGGLLAAQPGLELAQTPSKTLDDPDEDWHNYSTDYMSVFQTAQSTSHLAGTQISDTPPVKPQARTGVCSPPISEPRGQGLKEHVVHATTAHP